MSLIAADGTRKYLSAGERQRFLTSIPVLEEPVAETYCELLFWTGCRPSEALALTAALTVAGAADWAGGKAWAQQDLFRPAAVVNDDVISVLDLAMRVQLAVIAAGVQDSQDVRRRLTPQVLRSLIEDGLVESRVGTRDKRERHLHLTETGAALERELSEAQRARMRAAFREAGPEAVAGFRRVLEQMMDAESRALFNALKEGP